MYINTAQNQRRVLTSGRVLELKLVFQEPIKLCYHLTEVYNEESLSTEIIEYCKANGFLNNRMAFLWWMFAK